MTQQDEPASQGARVLARILQMIASGELVAGQRLVEPAIAARLGVGTVPVREALRVLAGDGVVDIIPHKGARLRLMTAKEISDTMKGIVGLLLVALDELEGRDCATLVHGLRETEARIATCQRAGNCFAILNETGNYQLDFIRASGNDYVARSIRKVHFEYYNNQLCRFIDASDLAGISANYARLTDHVAAGNWAAARALFRQFAAAVCDRLAAASKVGALPRTPPGTGVPGPYS